MVLVIKNELDKYLEFDSSELFDKRYSDYASVFGGAIRDIVSGEPDKINDIDIIGLPISLHYISDVLEMNGYTKMDLIKPDLNAIYKDIRFIFEPLTYINNNLKIVQLIRPHNNNVQNRPPNEFNLVRQNYYSLLTNVDLTSSGLFYDGEELYESINYSYIHCKMKVYEKIPHAMMFNSIRTHFRGEKLRDRRGWSEFKNDPQLIRAMKIHKIQNNDIVKSHNDYLLKTKNFVAKSRDGKRPLNL